VLLGLYLVGLDPETWKTEMDAEDAWIVVITALLGALLGSVLLGLLAGVLGVGLAALGIVSAGTAFIISAAIGLALKFFVDSVDDSKVKKATSSFTGTRVSTSRSTRGVAAQSLNSAAPVYNDSHSFLLSSFYLLCD